MLVEPTDVDGMTVAMWRLLSDDALWQQMAQKGLKRAHQFSWRKAAQETLNIYHSLG
jgi:glycosyltransferase involved in cell wall biosynthesis